MGSLHGLSMNRIFIVRWSETELVSLVDFGMSKSEHEYEQVMRVLRDTPDDPWEQTSNPVRDMIVHSVSDRNNRYEIWEFETDVSEDELLDESRNIELFKMKIRSIGEEIYSTIGKEK